jgi:hypothetical protein
VQWLRVIACVRSQRNSAERASTISREIKRNGGQECYRANQADESAWDRGRHPKTCKLAQKRALACLVAGKLQRRWSPEQVAGWLKRTYPDDMSRQILSLLSSGLFWELEAFVAVEILVVPEQAPNGVQQFAHHRDHDLHRLLPGGNKFVVERPDIGLVLNGH